MSEARRRHHLDVSFGQVTTAGYTKQVIDRNRCPEARSEDSLRDGLNGQAVYKANMGRAGRYHHCDKAALTVIRDLPTPSEAIKLGVGAGDQLGQTVVQPFILFRTVAVDIAGATVLRRWHRVGGKFSQVEGLALPAHVWRLFRERCQDEEMRSLKNDLKPIPGTTYVLLDKTVFLRICLVQSIGYSSAETEAFIEFCEFPHGRQFGCRDRMHQ